MTVNPFRPIFVAVAAVLVAAGVAHADTLDAQFLGLLSNDGMNVGPPDRLIALAHERCDNDGLSRADVFNFRFGGHPSPFRVAMSKIAAELQAQGLTTEQVRPFMQDAITVYCPGATN
ncbi:MAG: DUF732 domain-containing protein [Mycobacterium sp.]|uniref:DUF732 domain-containing protein n=1 Tax=Mycobacterium sp. TaxID=1785 RepID=UPI003BB1BC5F